MVGTVAGVGGGTVGGRVGFLVGLLVGALVGAGVGYTRVPSPAQTTSPHPAGVKLQV